LIPEIGNMPATMFILYVSDQERSRAFYEKVLDKLPVLNVPGMTEFALRKDVILGIMPENGIAKIIWPTMPHPTSANGIPRSELYLYVESPEHSLEKAIEAGGKLVSEPSKRTWGDLVAYVADPDGHIIAFAK
jgi:predicted enzyme related to lactoylglutathione lyase